MCHVGKQSGRPLAATSVSGLPTSRLFRVTDKTTRVQYLVNTGAEVSVIPPSHIRRRGKPNHLTLQADNGTSIKTYGNQSLTLDLGLRRTFRWVFVTADIHRPILGTDFLRHFGLLVDMHHHCLLDGLTRLQVQGITCNTKSPSPSLLPRKSTSTYHKILADFPSLTQPCTSEAPIKHDVTHHIQTNRPPCQLALVDLAQTDCRWHGKNLTTCLS